MNFSRRATAVVSLFLVAFASAAADPLSREFEVDFGREVASRNLKGLATRSDGRILPGPTFTDLNGPRIADILWTLRPSGGDKFLVGTGPEGEVHEISVNARDNSYTVREVADVAETQATAVHPLADGSILVGTSPIGALYLFKDAVVVARVPLPVDSIFDFCALPDGSILAATGNPGRIYRIDPSKFAAAGVIEDKDKDAKTLPASGITQFAEIRDRNVRRVARLSDGRIVAGSAPKGNVYAFPAEGGAPVVLQENRDAEVVDLLPDDRGGFHAALVFSPGETSRINRPTILKPDAEEEPRPAFNGRSAIVRFPADGFPESVVSRQGVAVYRLTTHREWLLLAGGETGDVFGYDPETRRSLVFPGSASAQVSGLAPIGEGRFLALRNNAPGLGVLDFTPRGERQLETKRLDLGNAADLGLIRFSRSRNVDLSKLELEAQVNNGADELEGWTPWTPLKARDGAFSAEGLRGRYLKLRIKVPSAAKDFQVDKATVYHLPQNRRPQLTDFRIFPANMALVPAPGPTASVTANLGQLLFPDRRDAKDDGAEKRRTAFLNSQVVPQSGTQLIYWSVTDPDGDNLSYSLSIKPDDGDKWIDLAVDVTDSYAQFETSSLAEGLYLTRLTVKEQAPRPEKQRLNYAFETDYLRVDRTAPSISDAKVQRGASAWSISVTGTDATSLLQGAEFILNNGIKYSLEQPVDGIRDGRTETFAVEVPFPRAAGATAVEIILYDQNGNAASRRLELK
jgi:hypothetical protein